MLKKKKLYSLNKFLLPLNLQWEHEKNDTNGSMIKDIRIFNLLVSNGRSSIAARNKQEK